MSIAVDSQALRAAFTDLVKIPSPSFNERAVGDYVAAAVAKMGYRATEDLAGKKHDGDCGNVVVSVPASDPKLPALLITAHMDTVEDGVAPIRPLFDVANERFHTSGETILGGDDKAGVAVMLEVLRQLKEKKLPHGELLFVFAVAEEKGSCGAEFLDPGLYRGFAAGLVLDHSDPAEIVLGAPTKVDLHLTVHGIGGHAAFPEGRINAAQVLARTVGRLPQGRLDEHTTANLGISWSGTAVNIIPELAYAEYEIRSHREQLLDSHLAQILMLIENSVREARVANRDARGSKEAIKATIDVDLITMFSGYRLDDDAPAVRLLEKAIAARGLAPRKTLNQGGSDANTYNARGLPCVVVGCGMHDVHGTSEYADIGEMADCAGIVLAAITGQE